MPVPDWGLLNLMDFAESGEIPPTQGPVSTPTEPGEIPPTQRPVSTPTPDQAEALNDLNSWNPTGKRARESPKGAWQPPNKKRADAEDEDRQLTTEDAIIHNVKTTMLKMNVKEKLRTSDPEGTIAEVLQEVLTECILDLLPVMMKALKQNIKKIGRKLQTAPEETPAATQPATRPQPAAREPETNAIARVENLEQYGRRDCIRIHGLGEREREDTNQLVIETARALGVEVKTSDISVSHRLSSFAARRRSEPRPVIVKFTRRDIKHAMMKNKQQLKRSTHHYNVYIQEDMTRERARAAYELRQDGFQVTSEDGRLQVSKQGRVECVINSLAELEPKCKWNRGRVMQLFEVQQRAGMIQSTGNRQ